MIKDIIINDQSFFQFKIQSTMLLNIHQYVEKLTSCDSILVEMPWSMAAIETNIYAYRGNTVDKRADKLGLVSALTQKGLEQPYNIRRVLEDVDMLRAPQIEIKIIFADGRTVVNLIAEDIRTTDNPICARKEYWYKGVMITSLENHVVVDPPPHIQIGLRQ